MTFHFPYMQILNLKEREKEQALLVLGQMERKKEAILREYRSVDQERSELLLRMEAVEGTASIADIQQRNDYLAFLNQKMAGLKNQLAQAESEIANQKAQLLTKQQEEKTWLHLRENLWEKYIQKQKKAEQEAMDEMAAIRHFRQNFSM